MPAPLGMGRYMQMHFLRHWIGFAALVLILLSGCTLDGGTAVVAEFCQVYKPFPWTVYNGQLLQPEIMEYIDDNEIARNTRNC